MIVSNSFKDFSSNAFLVYFILVFSLAKSSLLVTMEYVLLNKEETTYSLQLLCLSEL